ncbi:serine protease [Mitsuaria sp. GD03876]|uniref:serine protease n=1 Tax=Mitsuaria sp. GD03876 TaxID=2975399 RepID=UPI00244A2650|nr:serine protease [Mitsuaria sp. GD03876]MDH0863925.1 serine protease [Mitsuaria sp. GD03876]
MKRLFKGWCATMALAGLLCAATNGTAQTSRNVALADVPLQGSPQYRDTVTRYLKMQQPKIVGGQLAPVGSFPWQVSLGVSWIASPYHAHFCGGSVYNETWIVTAAHCLVDMSPKDVIVTAGTNILGAGGSRHNVRRMIVKSNYAASTQDHDIALIELMEPLTLGTTVRAIPLISTQEEATLLVKDAAVVAVGWGATEQGGQKVRDLRFVSVPFVERGTCNRPLAYDGQITENMICAGVAAGGMDSCQGDSGGPLTVSTASAPRLAGVVSWGDGCAKPNRVGIYTRVANYGSWIQACVASPAACK